MDKSTVSEHTQPEPSRLSWKERAAYGSGDYGLNFFWQGVGFYLFFYYTDVLLLSNSLAGLMFAIGGFWDAVSDPIMGYIAERTKSRYGRYRPYLLLGAPVLSLSFFLLFLPPVFDDPFWIGVQVLTTLILFRTAYTLVSIPYAALSTRMVVNSEERTALAGVRMYCGFLGGVSVVAIGGWLRGHMPDESAFLILASVSGVIAFIALTCCFLFTKECSGGAHVGEPAASLRVLISTVLVNGPMLLLFVAIIFVTIATTFTVKTVLYVFEYQLMDRAAGDTTLYIFTVAPLVTIPLWSTLALKLGKAHAWVLASIASMAGLLWLYFFGISSVYLAWIGYGIVTLGLSAFGLLFWSMLPDTVEYGLAQSGVRNEAVIFGIASSSQKAALAASAFLLGFTLDVIGYEAGGEQTMEALSGLHVISTLLPFVVLFIAGAIMIFYPLNAGLHNDIVRSIRRDSDG